MQRDYTMEDRLLDRESRERPEAPAPRRKAVKMPQWLWLPALIAWGCLLVWMLFAIHPAADSENLRSYALAGRFSQFDNNTKCEALRELAYIRKHYSIPETDLKAPKPNAANYGSTTDPAVVQSVIDSASELLGDDRIAWTPDTELYPGSEIRYYCDETIFVLCWKEVGDHTVRTCAEVKIADASQLRRKLAGDSYGSEVQSYASDMAKDANAVVAINGDFYAFRNYGITAYQRKVYRTGLNDRIDTCFFTSSGDMLFTPSGYFSTADEVQRYVDENDVLFAISFGPVLVENGREKDIFSYPVGEIDEIYPRAAIGLLDELHYLLMTVNTEGIYGSAATIQRLADYMFYKGCEKAYAVDGGQTGVIVMDGAAVNRVSFGHERTMSDIIYFATALPNMEETP